MPLNKETKTKINKENLPLSLFDKKASYNTHMFGFTLFLLGHHVKTYSLIPAMSRFVSYGKNPSIM